MFLLLFLLQKKFKYMGKTLILTLFLVSTALFAQENEVPKSNETVENKNMLKVNLLALTVGNYSLQYERLITPKTTIGVTANYTPKRGLPFMSSFETILDDQNTTDQLENFKYASYSITPEVRFYLGKEGYKGFYIAPFARYTAYNDVHLPITYETTDNGTTTESIVLIEGKSTALSGGFAIGAQWKLSKKLYLDWMIMGPHFGSTDIDLKGNKALSIEDQNSLRDEIESLDVPFDIDYEIDENGVRAKTKTPWGGVRASIGIGYRF